MGQLGGAHWRRGMDLCEVTMVGIAEVLGVEEWPRAWPSRSPRMGGSGQAGVLGWGAVAAIPEPGAGRHMWTEAADCSPAVL